MLLQLCKVVALNRRAGALLALLDGLDDGGVNGGGQLLLLNKLLLRHWFLLPSALLATCLLGRLERLIAGPRAGVQRRRPAPLAGKVERPALELDLMMIIGERLRKWEVSERWFKQCVRINLIVSRALGGLVDCVKVGRAKIPLSQPANEARVASAQNAPG